MTKAMISNLRSSEWLLRMRALQKFTSFYWDDSETVFLGRLTIYIPILYTCQLFVSQMREISTLSWPKFRETSRRLPKISDEFPKISERC